MDIGCGWGGLLIYAVSHYGAIATGITLSRAQAELARQRIQQAGLGQRCRVELLDYRDLEPLGQFDKVASVGCRRLDEPGIQRDERALRYYTK